MTTLFLQRQKFQRLIDTILNQGFQLIGPRIKDGSIVFDHIDTVEQLPQGIHDEQAPGAYKLKKQPNANQTSPRWFSWSNGPQALKPLLFKPRELLWNVQRNPKGKLTFEPQQPTTKPLVVLGVRACDLAALTLQDQHFTQGHYRDPYYSLTRSSLLTIAVNCTHAADTCFCASTGDGPEVRNGYDICLSEIDDGFTVVTGSHAGKQLIHRLNLPPAGTAQLKTAIAESAAAKDQTRSMPSRNSTHTLPNLLDHPGWDIVSEQCLSCGNCTAVCPTCFCHDEHDLYDLSTETSQHYRQWSSCFSNDHSYMHGMLIRRDTRLRYRQWFTHKLSSWHDQYGRSGCVGCGRCITWCPVGIDIVEQANAILGEANA